ncbi:MAG: bis-aminopropyl spermidine synthase family protein [bacterium]|nr:bis-aminopropyl spermidine synthase family protein [bacterium]
MISRKTIRERIYQISKETGIPTKKLLDFLFVLRIGKLVENNELLQRVGVSKNTLNQVKELLFSLLKPPSKSTQLDESAIREVQSLFGPDYKPEEALWSILENEKSRKSVELLGKYINQRPSPERKYDQFTAIVETTVRRAGLLNFFEDIKGKRLLFLGDDDFTSVAVANFHSASEITVLDIDNRMLGKIDSISKNENLGINSDNYDARKPLPVSYSGKFDVVFTDPPYTTDGIKLFVSRAIQALEPSNQAARIYICYGNSDRAKERFLPIQEIFTASGLMVRWIFDKFNRYQGAESIGSASSLFILEVTANTKSLIFGNYDRPIYTNN